jgi:predicted small secreted protein
MVRKIILAVTVSALALTATACNTVRGAGQDLQSVADDVDEAI